MRGWKHYTPYIRCERCTCLRPPAQLCVDLGSTVCKDSKACKATAKRLKTEPKR